MTDDRREVLPETWTVPANLADFECKHGLLPGECEECDSLAQVREEVGRE